MTKLSSNIPSLPTVIGMVLPAACGEANGASTVGLVVFVAAASVAGVPAGDILSVFL